MIELDQLSDGRNYTALMIDAFNYLCNLLVYSPLGFVIALPILLVLSHFMPAETRRMDEDKKG